MRPVTLLKISILGIVFTQAHVASGRTVFNGQIHDSGSNKDKILFNLVQEATDGEGGRLQRVTTFKNPDGSVALIESAESVRTDNGEKLKKFSIDQQQTHAQGSVEIIDGVAHFKYSENGKMKTSEEKVKGIFIVPPMIVDLLASHWSEITAGKTLPTRFAVLERQESVGFDFFKEKEVEIDGQKLVVVKMKPTSFVIAALVDPLRFYMTPDGKRVVQIDGRTTVKRLVNGKYKDLDALATYTYPEVREGK